MLFCSFDCFLVMQFLHGTFTLSTSSVCMYQYYSNWASNHIEVVNESKWLKYITCQNFEFSIVCLQDLKALRELYWERISVIIIKKDLTGIIDRGSFRQSIVIWATSKVDYCKVLTNLFFFIHIAYCYFEWFLSLIFVFDRAASHPWAPYWTYPTPKT